MCRVGLGAQRGILFPGWTWRFSAGVFSLSDQSENQPLLITYIKYRGHTHKGTLAKDVELGSQRAYFG